jgi:hypothetical protein
MNAVGNGEIILRPFCTDLPLVSISLSTLGQSASHALLYLLQRPMESRSKSISAFVHEINTPKRKRHVAVHCCSAIHIQTLHRAGHIQSYLSARVNYPTHTVCRSTDKCSSVIRLCANKLYSANLTLLVINQSNPTH